MNVTNVIVTAIIVSIIAIIFIGIIVYYIKKNRRKIAEAEKQRLETEENIRILEKEIAENEAKIEKRKAELKAYYDEQKEKYDTFSPFIKDLVFDFSLIRDDGTISHLFHYGDKYTFILWQNEDGFEVSVHDAKTKKGLYYAYQTTKDEFTKKFIFEVINILTTFVAKIRLNGHGETNSMREGIMTGYQSGYIAGYLRGQTDSGNNIWDLPEKEERLKDLTDVPNKISNMQK